MRFTVEGTDSTTGFDRKLSIEAGDAAQAEVKARAAGLLISSIRPTDGVIDYARLADDDPSDQVVPEYQDIVRGAKIVRVISRIVLFAGAMCFAIGALVLLVATSQSSPPDRYIIRGVACMIAGAILLPIGFIVRLFAALSLAIRDIARNSFTHASDAGEITPSTRRC